MAVSALAVFYKGQETKAVESHLQTLKERVRFGWVVLVGSVAYLALELRELYIFLQR